MPVRTGVTISAGFSRRVGLALGAATSPLPAPVLKRRSVAACHALGRACAGTCWSRGSQDRGRGRVNCGMGLAWYDVGRDVGGGLCGAGTCWGVGSDNAFSLSVPR